MAEPSAAYGVGTGTTGTAGTAAPSENGAGPSAATPLGESSSSSTAVTGEKPSPSPSTAASEQATATSSTTSTSTSTSSTSTSGGTSGGGSDSSRPAVQTTVSRFVKNVPKLERKHSSGDLHSRLKTRKVLGVGATDNGDVHRSKISQVLGHNEHLYVRFPRGLLGWYLLVTCGLGLQGGLLVASPAWAAHLRLLTAGPADLPALGLVSRGYGVTLIGLSHLLYAVYSTSDKVIIRSGLGVLILTDVCAMGSQLIHMFQEDGWSRWSWLHIGLRGLSAGVSLLYLNLSRNYYAGVRKSPTPAPAIDMDARKKSL